KIAKDAEKLDDTVSDELESKEPGLNYARGGKAFQNFWNTARQIRARGGNVAQRWADHYLRQDIGGNGIRPDPMPAYDQAPRNDPDNHLQLGQTPPLGGEGDQLPVKQRKGRGAFARGGLTMNKNPYASPAPDGVPPSIAVKHRAAPNPMAAWQNGAPV